MKTVPKNGITITEKWSVATIQNALLLVNFSSMLFWKEQMTISVKKNLVVKQIANNHDGPNALLKFCCKIISFTKATLKKPPPSKNKKKILWISHKISGISANLSLNIPWNLTFSATYYKPWLQYVTIHHNKGNTKFYHRWNRTALYIFIYFLPSVCHFPL